MHHFDQVRTGRGLYIAYCLVGLATFLFLTFFDGYRYNAWNWLIAVPVNSFLATIWPIYWLVLRWLIGHQLSRNEVAERFLFP